jgi:2-keto-4-pentenoate hydratase
MSTPRLDASAHRTLAERLHRAYRSAEALPPLRHNFDLAVADGYEVQRRFVKRRQETEGEVIGYTVAPASADTDGPRAMGRVLSSTVQSDGVFSRETYISPRVRPAVALRLTDKLTAPATSAEVLSATDALIPVVELVDCRIREWDVTPPESIADNAHGTAVALGDPVSRVAETNFSTERVALGIEGSGGERAAEDAGIGNPVEALKWVVSELGARGQSVAAGDLVVSAPSFARIPVEAGDRFRASFSTLGEVSVEIRGDK